MIEISLIALVGGLLGVLFMVPLRNALIVKEHGVLPYPEGSACAEVLLAGENGGGAFLLIYVAMVLCLGIPIMMAEFYIGRRGGKNPVGSIKVLAPKTHWNLIGYIGILAAFVVLAFYSTVSGWTLEYIYKAVTNFFANKDIATIEQGFTDFHNNPFRPFLWQFIFMGITAFIIFKGVKDGVEKYTKILI